jgi:hypothetical protein
VLKRNAINSLGHQPFKCNAVILVDNVLHKQATALDPKNVRQQLSRLDRSGFNPRI